MAIVVVWTAPPSIGAGLGGAAASNVISGGLPLPMERLVKNGIIEVEFTGALPGVLPPTLLIDPLLHHILFGVPLSLIPVMVGVPMGPNLGLCIFCLLRFICKHKLGLL